MGRTKLDYSYGSDEKDVDEIVADDEEFVITDRKGNVVNAKKKKVNKVSRLPASVKTHKYLHYEEYANFDNKGGDEVGDGNGDGDDEEEDGDFGRLDVKGWNTFVGFMAVRVASPVLLLLHAIASGIYVYMCEFDFSPEGTLAKGPYGGIGTMIVLSVSMHAFLVHAVNKWLFSGTYWKKRADYENEKRNRA